MPAELLQRNPTLLTVRDQLRRVPGPYLYNTIRSQTSWTVLAALLSHPAGITHAALDTLGTADATRMLRSFLVTTLVLPWRDENLHQLEQWLKTASAGVGVNEDRLTFVRFATFRHLHRARRRGRTNTEAANDRRELRLVLALLRWLHDQGLTLRTARQADIDRWLVTTPNGGWVKPFTEWCWRSRITRRLTVPARQRASNQLAGISATEHLELVRRVLDPAAPIEARDRLAAGLILIFGVRAHHIARLKLDSITTERDRTSILIGVDPLVLPEPLSSVARAAKNGSMVRSFGGAVIDTVWLYPGRIHGSPLTAASVAYRLRAIGIPPNVARRTALTHLALQVPPAVLSRLLGISITTACSWALAVASSSATYSAAVRSRTGNLTR